MNIEKINGNEIIDFLNQSRSKFSNCSLSLPFVFDSQIIKDGIYRLRFSVKFNNWGTLQTMSNNTIKIIDGKIVVWLDEPFEGDGSEEILKDVLTEWLPTHEFIDQINQSEIFDNIIEEVYKSLPDVSIDNKDILDEIIKKLNVAKTLMK